MSLGNPAAIDRGQSGAYRDYSTNSDFVYDPGVMVLPVGSADAETVTVRYHGGYAMRTVNFSAMKNGNPPVLPTAEDLDNDTLVSANLVLPIPIPDPSNNGYVWSAKGSYSYVTTNRPRIPGRDYFPAVQRPYPMPQDEVATATLGGSTLDSQKSLITASDFENGTYKWAFTILPNTFFNPNMVY